MQASLPIDAYPAALAELSVELESLREENAELRLALGSLQKENEALCAERDDLHGKHASLAFELNELKRMLFGAKSERFVPQSDSSDQLELFPEAVAFVEKTASADRTRPAGTGQQKREQRTKRASQPLPPHLPRNVITIEPEGDLSGLKKIGVEVTETLDYVPGRLVVLRRERPKYVDPNKENSGHVVRELPARLIDKGMAEPGLLAHVVIEKYLVHVPLYRQRERFLREGIQLPSSTLGNWVAQTAWHLTPLYDALKRDVCESGYLQVDETTIRVQDAQKKRKTHSGYYWVYLAPGKRLVVLEYRKGRARAGPATFLAGFAGALQTDGYSAYEGFAQEEGIATYACWAHARRNFYQARDNDVERAAHVLDQIKLLYAVERRLREQGASAKTRRDVRQEEAVPVLDALKTWLEENPGLPKSPWGKAVNYSLNRWEQ